MRLTQIDILHFRFCGKKSMGIVVIIHALIGPVSDSRPPMQIPTESCYDRWPEKIERKE